MRYFTFAVTTLLPLASALPGPPVSAVVVDASDQLFKREVTSCVAGAPDYGHAVELMDCVKWFRDNNNYGFGTWNCAGKTFHIGGNAWNSAKDCVTGCVDCMMGHAGQGRHSGKCDQRATFATCWFIYCNEGTTC
ncbi:hypothetical protein IQ07DRAFT_637230 [Pyrenochaeta sp. DS3sAY3a]|nr:hypothetical protein IQ07DRAFT_637230 [Pyrenochaeta sp. DS3sAY3a]